MITEKDNVIYINTDKLKQHLENNGATVLDILSTETSLDILCTGLTKKCFKDFKVSLKFNDHFAKIFFEKEFRLN